jgi:hypothetical protein
MMARDMLRWLAFAVLVGAVSDARGEAFEESSGGFAVEGAIVPGAHLRLDTPNGAVHVWVPEGYQPETATLVVYIHGYYVDVDDAWWAHGLPEQFGAAGINAMFIVPESPTCNADEVRWESISDLALTVEGHIPYTLPKGRRVVIGHSGGFRTIARWLGNDLDTAVLLDAGYGARTPYVEWLKKSASHQLITISAETTWWSQELSKMVAVEEVDGFGKLGPRSLDRLGHERAVFIKTDLDHWQVVTTTLPATLRMLRATKL